MATIDKAHLQTLLAKIRAAKEASLQNQSHQSQSPKLPAPASSIGILNPPQESNPEPESNPLEITDKYGNLITLNAKQSEFVSLASSGKSCVLIGAAGTGKTTSQKAVVQSLIQNGLLGLLDPQGHKHLISQTPGIVICAYTRRAVANIKRNMPADLQNNCITIHKLLEYQPTYYTTYDPVTGDEKTKMVFEPARDASNPLPASIRCIIFEEASMIGTDLHRQVIDACPHNPQIIYLGDIQQLPPVFGPAILGFKLLELPVVELTEVYRQALESPIIKLAHRILSGNPLTKDRPANYDIHKSSDHRRQFLTDGFEDWKFPGQLTIHPWKKKIDAHNALNTAGQFFIQCESKGIYDPEEDIILIPFNKSFGTDELNKIIANHLSKKRNASVYEIIGGFNKHYLSAGDKVLYDKEDAIVLDIVPNPSYGGAPTQLPSSTLDYWGYDPNAKAHRSDETGDVDFLLSQVAMAETSEERVRQCSHIVTLRMMDSDTIIKLDKAAEINALALGYAITIHKSQGSEWRKVFLCLHQSHATMIQRELLYTAVTRAREELYIICEPETFVKGIQSQRVKGNTLEEKAEYFKGKLEHLN
jgi:ATP-dependent exoDNAse (exonuclease V) alpha subunit